MEDVKSQEKTPTFTGIACDSREVKSGYAFVAISGFKTDGNKYINEAIENGARVIFTDKKLDKSIISKKDIPIIKVDDARTYLAYLAAEYYDYPSDKLNLIGITGTNGKTTTTHLIYNLLNYHNNLDNNNTNTKSAGLIGTVHVDTGKKLIAGDLTTPDPITLQKYLDDMVNNDLKYACMEVSSHGIKLKRIKGTNFAVKVGTNISADHFDLHPNFNDYMQVKKGFLEGDEDDTLVLLNNDNKYINSFGKIAKKQINFAINNNADVVADSIKKWNRGQQFTYHLNQDLINNRNEIIKPCQISIKMNLPGSHNIYNALIAITIALYYKIPKESIKLFFENFQGIWRRLQFIHDEDFTIIDDCAHNPGSYNAIFSSIMEMEYNNLIIVNSLRGNRGTLINKKNAETISNILKKMNKYILITSNCNEVVKEIDEVCEQEEDAFINTLIKNNINFQHCQLLKPALSKALESVSKNDIILLLGPHAMDNAGEMMLEMIETKV